MWTCCWNWCLFVGYFSAGCVGYLTTAFGVLYVVSQCLSEKWNSDSGLAYRHGSFIIRPSRLKREISFWWQWYIYWLINLLKHESRILSEWRPFCRTNKVTKCCAAEYNLMCLHFMFWECENTDTENVLKQPQSRQCILWLWSDQKLDCIFNFIISNFRWVIIQHCVVLTAHEPQYYLII